MIIKKIIATTTLLFLICFITSLSVEAYNYEYVNVTTRVNVTNSPPEILQVLADESITLSAGGLKTVTCNATVRDWNGWEDVVDANATFYHSTNSSDDPDNGNAHYTNSSCTLSQIDAEVYLAKASCSFEVIYYANQGDWFCNVTVEDDKNFTASLENSTTVNALHALNVTDVIDYGNLSVMDTSLDVSAFITNLGNTNTNVSVIGYGETESDGLGLKCTLGDDISVEHQRFSAVPGIVYNDKTVLDQVGKDMNLTLVQPTDGTVPVQRETFWQLFVPPNPQGICTGTLRFTATAP